MLGSLALGLTFTTLQGLIGLMFDIGCMFYCPLPWLHYFKGYLLFTSLGCFWGVLLRLAFPLMFILDL
jgi:hypothetical protein